MIEFKKITSVHTEILMNGVKIGHVETYGKTVVVEVMYSRKELRNNKSMVEMYVERLYHRILKQQYQSFLSAT